MIAAQGRGGGGGLFTVTTGPLSTICLRKDLNKLPCIMPGPDELHQPQHATVCLLAVAVKSSPTTP